MGGNVDDWIPGSPMTNGQGDPVVLYHGTRHEFDEFSKDYCKPTWNNAQQRLGFFFTDDLEYATKHAKGRNGRVVCVHLALRNPKIETVHPDYDLDMIAYVERGMTMEEADEYADGLIAQGHDGIIFKLKCGLTEIVPFYTDQIRIVDVIPIRPKRRTRAPAEEAPAPGFGM